MITLFTLLNTSAPGVRCNHSPDTPQSRGGDVHVALARGPRSKRNDVALVYVGSLLLLLVSISIVKAGEDARSALAVQRNALSEAVSKRDASAAARAFTSDAKLFLPGFATLSGRDAIQKSWQAGLSSGALHGITLVPDDVTGDGADLLVETGNVSTFGADGKARNRYLLVWKREESEWRIHRDIVNSEVAPAPSTGSGQAPKVDRVGFPRGYRSAFKVLGVPARTNTSPGLVLTAYGNELAASVTDTTHSAGSGRAQLAYPNGSIIVMEFAKVLQDEGGKPLLDVSGQPQKGEVEHIDVMRRGDRFGEAYGPNRAGDWEFAGYHLDGTYSTSPARSASCAQCHQKAGAAKDFVFPLKKNP